MATFHRLLFFFLLANLSSSSALLVTSKENGLSPASSAQQVTSPTDPITPAANVAQVEVSEEKLRLARQETREQADLIAQQAMAESARYQFYLSVGALVFSIVGVLVLIWTLRETGRTAEAAVKQAEIAIATNQPVVVPRVSRVRFRPSEGRPESESFKISLYLTFQNIGATPAALQRVGARLFVTRDAPPSAASLGDLPHVIRSDILGKDGRGGGKEWALDYALDAAALERLNGPATGDYLRCYLVGFAAYNDFFGIHHIRYFCLKVTSNGFQPMRGTELNYVVKRPISRKTDDD